MTYDRKAVIDMSAKRSLRQTRNKTYMSRSTMSKGLRTGPKTPFRKSTVGPGKLPGTSEAAKAALRAKKPHLFQNPGGAAPAKPPVAKLISKAQHDAMNAPKPRPVHPLAGFKQKPAASSPSKHTVRVKVGGVRLKATTTAGSKGEAVAKLKGSKKFASAARAFAAKHKPAGASPSAPAKPKSLARRLGLGLRKGVSSSGKKFGSDAHLRELGGRLKTWAKKKIGLNEKGLTTMAWSQQAREAAKQARKRKAKGKGGPSSAHQGSQNRIDAEREELRKWWDAKRKKEGRKVPMVSDKTKGGSVAMTEPGQPIAKQVVGPVSRDVYQAAQPKRRKIGGGIRNSRSSFVPDGQVDNNLTMRTFAPGAISPTKRAGALTRSGGTLVKGRKQKQGMGSRKVGSLKVKMG